MVGKPNPRVCGNKVRTGCLTCKARHLKCGEEKPQCRRCITARRNCDGYSSSKPTMTPARKRSANDLIMIHYTADIPAALNMAVRRDSREQRSLDYFRTRTAPDLISCFGSELWSLYVLQLAQDEPAVRHSVIAIGSLHEQFEIRAIGQIVDPQFALGHYNKAIRHVIGSFKTDSNHSIDIALLLSALFASFESLQGHYRSALAHINSGIKVLHERQSNGSASSRSYIPFRLLNSLFGRLESQVIEIGDLSMTPAHNVGHNTLADLHIPSSFTTVGEAEDSLNLYLHKLHNIQRYAYGTAITFSPAQIEALEIAQAHLLSTFEQWSAAFDRYLVDKLEITSTPQHLDQFRIQPGTYIIQIWRTVVKGMLSLNQTSNETAWDCFVDHFESIVDLAASFLVHTAKWIPCRSPEVGSTPQKTTALPGCSKNIAACNASEYRESLHSSASSSTSSNRPNCDAPDVSRSTTGNLPPLAPKPAQMMKPTFSLSLGIIPPLYIVCTRCRDPAIRKRALNLLSTCNRREGIWDSWLSSRVAKRIIEIEEAGAQEYLRSKTEKNVNDVLEPVEITSISQIPEHVRVVHLWTSFGPERQGEVRYTKSNSGQETLSSTYEVFEERFNW